MALQWVALLCCEPPYFIKEGLLLIYLNVFTVRMVFLQKSMKYPPGKLALIRVIELLIAMRMVLSCKWNVISRILETLRVKLMMKDLADM